MATHSSILAWRIPQMGEPGEIQSMGLQGIRYDWNDLALRHTRETSQSEKTKYCMISTIAYPAKDKLWRNFPGSLVVKTPHFHCRGHGFDPWWGTAILHALWWSPKKPKPMETVKGWAVARGQERLGKTSLVVQWMRVCLPVQGTRGGSLVQGDSTCCENN